MTLKSLILDLDGTLIDSRPGILESFSVAVNAVYPGRKFDPETVVLGPPIRDMFAISFPDGTESEREKLFRSFREHYDREGSLKTQLYEGAREVLSLCRQRGIDLYVATNKPSHISLAILSQFAIGDDFRCVLAVDSVKPPFADKAAIIQRLLQDFEINIPAAYYVGDSVEDAIAAGRCDLRFVWAAYGYGKLDERVKTAPFGVIKSLGELTRFLE
jgi:phosphoglycolate phosphatase